MNTEIWSSPLTWPLSTVQWWENSNYNRTGVPKTQSLKLPWGPTRWCVCMGVVTTERGFPSIPEKHPPQMAFVRVYKLFQSICDLGTHAWVQSSEESPFHCAPSRTAPHTKAISLCHRALQSLGRIKIVFILENKTVCTLISFSNISQQNKSWSAKSYKIREEMKICYFHNKVF